MSYSKFQFEQKGKEHTRVAAHKNSQGDHYSTNRPNYTSASGEIKVGITDHYVIYDIRKMNARIEKFQEAERVSQNAIYCRISKSKKLQ